MNIHFLNNNFQASHAPPEGLTIPTLLPSPLIRMVWIITAYTNKLNQAIQKQAAADYVIRLHLITVAKVCKLN